MNIEFVAIYAALAFIAMAFPVAAMIPVRIASGTWNPIRGLARCAAIAANDSAAILAAVAERMQRFGAQAEQAEFVRATTQVVDMRDVLDSGATQVNVRVAEMVASTDACDAPQTQRLQAVAACEPWASKIEFTAHGSEMETPLPSACAKALLSRETFPYYFH